MERDKQEGPTYRDLYHEFASRADITSIQATLAMILAKIDLMVTKETHEMIWRADTEWKRSTQERLDSIRNALDIAKSGENVWSIELRTEVKKLRDDLDNAKLSWMTELRRDVESLKAERVPARVFIIAAWVIPPILTYFLVHLGKL